MEMIYLVISFLGRAGMAANFGGKIWLWEVQNKIYLSFLACAIVCRQILLFVLLFDCVCLLAYMGPWRMPGQYGANIYRLRCLVASIEALSMAHWLMSSVLYRRIALAIEMASRLDAFVLIVFFAYLYGTRAVSRAIQSEYLTDCGVQWLQLKR